MPKGKYKCEKEVQVEDESRKGKREKSEEAQGWSVFFVHDTHIDTKFRL